MFAAADILFLLVMAMGIAMSLLVWFKTDAFIEYLRLFKLDKFFKVRNFLTLREHDPLLTYHQFLLMYHSNFLTRLITCPICLSVWLGTLGSLIINIWLSMPLSFLSLLFYLFLTKLLKDA